MMKILISIITGLASLIGVCIGVLFEHNQIVNIFGYGFMISTILTFLVISYDSKKHLFKR